MSKRQFTDFINTESMEPIPDPAPVEVEAEADPVVRVRFLNTNEYAGHYLVADESGQGYLVPISELQYTSGWQEVTKRSLDLADRPYNLDSEIQRLLVKHSDVRKALWSMGIVTQEEAAKADVREMVAKLIMKGVLPIVIGE